MNFERTSNKLRINPLGNVYFLLKFCVRIEGHLTTGIGSKMYILKISEEENCDQGAVKNSRDQASHWLKNYNCRFCIYDRWRS